MTPLDLADGRPPYRQLADALRAELASGKYTAGERFPSHGEVATAFGVSVGTVKRAYMALQDDGLIVTRQGQGSFVRLAADSDHKQGTSIDELARRLEIVEQRLDALQQTSS